MHVLADVLHWAVVSSLRASVLAILVLAITAVGRRWLRPGLAYVLWALVVLLLALPRIPSSPLSMYSLVPPAASASVLAPVERAVVGGSLLPSPSPSAGAHSGATKAPDALSPRGSSSTAKAASGDPSLPAWQLALVALWLAGIVFLLGKVAGAERRLQRSLRHARPVTDARVLGVWNECLGAGARGMGPHLAEVDGIPSPVLLGVMRPRVLLPEGLATRLTDDELRHIFVHELVHYRRRDILVNWLGALLTIVHWFNPLVWWSARRLADAQELACDASAMGRLRTEEPTAYGRTLVRVLELTRFEDPRVPSIAGIMSKGSLTRRRIQMIHLFKGPGAKWSVAGGGALVVALTIVAMTRSGLPVAQAHTATPPATTRGAASNNASVVGTSPRKGTVPSTTQPTGQSTSPSAGVQTSSRSSTASAQQSGSQSHPVSSTQPTTTSSGAAPVAVKATWKVSNTGEINAYTARIFPVQFTLYEKGAHPQSEQYVGGSFPSGEPLTIGIDMMNTSSVAHPNMALHLNPWVAVVQIVPYSPTKGFGAPVWQGKITDGPTNLPANSAAAGIFVWDETNSAGAQVPAGMYAVRFSGADGGGVLLSGTLGGKAFSGGGAAYPSYNTFGIR